MKIGLCAVDTRLAGAWRRALPGTGGLPPEPAARAMLRGIQDALCPRPFPASLADVYAF